jgi:hypothetical protein
MIDLQAKTIKILSEPHNIPSSDIVHMDIEFTFRYEAETGNIGMNIGGAAPVAFFPCNG